MDQAPQILNQNSQAKIQKQTENNKKADAMREQYRHQAFMLMIQLAVFIGIPAFLALWLGRKIDATQNSGNLYTLIFLGLAVIISWTIIIIKYKKFDKHIKEVEQNIKNNNH